MGWSCSEATTASKGTALSSFPLFHDPPLASADFQAPAFWGEIVHLNPRFTLPSCVASAKSIDFSEPVSIL